MNSKAHSIKDKLRNISQKTNITFNELWLELAIERFLFRVSCSKFYRHFIFKGGILLGQYIELNRETKDLDFLITGIKYNKENLKSIFIKILEQNIDDGVKYSFLKIEEMTHPQMKYSGLRVTLKVSLGKMKEQFSIDIGFGIAIDYIEKKIYVLPKVDKPIFTDEISLLVYPPEFIFAEKLETSVYFEMDNSRMKDYHDMYLIIKNNILDRSKLKSAIIKTFNNRNTRLRFPIFDFEPDDKMKLYWERHISKVKPVVFPQTINDVISEINAFINNVFMK